MSGQRRRRAGQWPYLAVPALAALLAVTQFQAPVVPSAAAPKATPNPVAPTGGSGDNGNGKNQGSGNDGKDFTMAGSVSGLFPGDTRALVVTLTNTNNFPLLASGLTATVADPAGPCTAAAIQVTGPSGSVTIPKNGTAPATYTVRMSNSAPDACKSTTFALTYKGTAVKA